MAEMAKSWAKKWAKKWPQNASLEAWKWAEKWPQNTSLEAARMASSEPSWEAKEMGHFEDFQRGSQWTFPWDRVGKPPPRDPGNPMIRTSREMDGFETSWEPPTLSRGQDDEMDRKDATDARQEEEGGARPPLLYNII